MDFKQKASFVSGVHTKDPPNSITYSIVISCYSIHVGFLLVYLDSVDVTAFDMENK